MTVGNKPGYFAIPATYLYHYNYAEYGDDKGLVVSINTSETGITTLEQETSPVKGKYIYMYAVDSLGEWLGVEYFKLSYNHRLTSPFSRIMHSK